MKIKLTTIYVSDQEKALGFYTDILGMSKKNDFSQGSYRWLTVVSPEVPESSSSRSTTTPRGRHTRKRCSRRTSPR